MRSVQHGGSCALRGRVAHCTRLSPCSSSSSLCVAATSTTWRHLVTPTGGSSSGSSSGRQGHLATVHVNRMHPLYNSTGQRSKYTTACGRSFDPNIFLEALQACEHPSWLTAIQQEMAADAEYRGYLRQHGGIMDTLQRLDTQHLDDDAAMTALRTQMQTDYALSLSLCAMVDAYTRIRQRRDEHTVAQVADGRVDPYEHLRRHSHGRRGGGNDGSML